MEQPIEVSPDALVAFKQRVANRSTTPVSIRFGVKGGACAGFRYSISFDDEKPGSRDIAWTIDGLTFVIDPKSLIYMSGTRVVWHESVMQKGFDFENPHEASRCGCGSSFSPK